MVVWAHLDRIFRCDARSKLREDFDTSFYVNDDDVVSELARTFSNKKILRLFCTLSDVPYPSDDDDESVSKRTEPLPRKQETTDNKKNNDEEFPAFLSPPGEIFSLVRSIDWGSTELGPISRWPQSLRTSVDAVLNSSFPMALLWGPDLRLIYNQAYIPVFGDRHPAGYGLRFCDVWHELWDDFKPMFHRVMVQGESLWFENQPLWMTRSGYLEETYFTWSYSPVRNEEGNIMGVLAPVCENTERVLSERRLTTCRDVSQLLSNTKRSTSPSSSSSGESASASAATANAATASPRSSPSSFSSSLSSSPLSSLEQLTKEATSAFNSNPNDIQYALIYLRNPSRPQQLQLFSSHRVPAGHPAALPEIDLDTIAANSDDGDDSNNGARSSSSSSSTSTPTTCLWPLSRLLSSKEGSSNIVMTGLTKRDDALASMPGVWSSPDTASIFTLPSLNKGVPSGVIIFGVNPRRVYDDVYKDFLALLATQIGSALNSIRLLEEETKRAESLSALDRTKTMFFTNISHEFRTPLTLILAPLEEMIETIESSSSSSSTSSSLDPTTTSAGGGPSLSSVGSKLNVMRRNVQRLMKLVNNLLNYMRIEAGRVKALYKRVSIPKQTLNIVSMFASALDQAGLELRTSIPTPRAATRANNNNNNSDDDDDGEDDDVEGYIDLDMWENIISNLMSNAFKFTFNGFISVSVRKIRMSDPPRNLFDNNNNDDNTKNKDNNTITNGDDDYDGIELVVRDTGVGIPEDELSHVFERFHRVEGKAGRSYEGSGIGLAYTMELVKMHGGNIDASSVFGQGTAFRVVIPMGYAHLPAAQVIHDDDGDDSDGEQDDNDMEIVNNDNVVDPATKHTSSSSSSSSSSIKSKNNNNQPMKKNEYLEEVLTWVALHDDDDDDDNDDQDESKNNLQGVDSIPTSTTPITATTATTTTTTTSSSPSPLVKSTSTTTIAASPAFVSSSPHHHPHHHHHVGLPRSLSSSPALPRYPSPSPSSRKQQYRILVVDDNRDMQRYVGGLLRQFWTVIIANNGMEALAEIERHIPDLLLSDVMMPHMDGFELLRHVREDARSRDLPVMLLSARSGEEAAVEGIGAGANDYLVKPFKANELIVRVQKLLQTGQVHRQLERRLTVQSADLRETEFRYKILEHFSPVGIVHTDSKGIITYFNQKYQELLGAKSYDDVIGRGWEMFIHPDNRDQVINSWYETVQTTGKYSNMVKFRRADGTSLWGLVDAIPISSDQLHNLLDIPPIDNNNMNNNSNNNDNKGGDGDDDIGYIASIIDVTDYRRLEQEKMDAVQHAEEIQRKRAQDADIHRRQQESFIDIVCHEIRNPLNGIVNNSDLLLETLAARETWLMASSTSTLPTTSTMTTTTTTAPQSYNNNINKNDNVDEIIVRLKKQIPDDREALDAIITCARHQQNITNDVLNSSRLEAGLVELNLTNFVPSTLVHSVMNMFVAEMARKGIDVESVFHPSASQMLHGDPDRISQILINLISNSVKFVQDRPNERRVTVSVQVKDDDEDKGGKGEGGADLPRKLVCVAVEDTGSGMDEEEMKVLFQRFSGQRKKIQEYGGSGMGLFISKKLSILMHGDIAVESTKNEGSKFTLTVRCDPSSPSATITTTTSSSSSSSMINVSSASTSASGMVVEGGVSQPLSLGQQSHLSTGGDGGGGGAGRSCSLLIVEDNIVNQKVLRRHLELAGHTCEIAGDGLEAVQKFSSGCFDLIFMDIEMPRMNGVEATRIIRSIEQERSGGTVPEGSQCPIVGLSGNARQQHIDEAIQAGMQMFLIKPYNKQNILNVIDQLVSSRH